MADIEATKIAEKAPEPVQDKPVAAALPEPVTDAKVEGDQEPSQKD